jgi:hypothetical protein
MFANYARFGYNRSMHSNLTNTMVDVSALTSVDRIGRAITAVY